MNSNLVRIADVVVVVFSQACDLIVSSLQHETLNRHLLYMLVDILLCFLFPSESSSLVAMSSAKRVL